MDSFSSFKTDDSNTLNMKLMSPIESCYRSPLRDTTNCIVPVEVGGSKKSDPVGPHQLPGEKREFTEENDFSQCQQSTPVRHLDCDTESDTTAEYESAGEASPWEKPSNVSALADYLAGVHLSTPDKIHNELTYFPFSPISAEDECDDEVTAIISSGSQASSHTLSFHEREEISVSEQDKDVSQVANTSFSDVDSEEFKNSIPCKRHSETNVLSSFLHSETSQLSDEAFSKDGVNFVTEMCCSVEENQLKTPPPSLNEKEEIISTVVAAFDKLCEPVSPSRFASLDLSDSEDGERSDYIIERILEEHNISSSDDVISEVEPSLNISQTSHINDYVTTTKHKIDTIFCSNKEIVSNRISETEHPILFTFDPKTSINLDEIVEMIKKKNAIESNSSPQKKVLLEKITSPISSAKKKIDSLFSPKKTVIEKETFEKTSGSGVSVVNESLKKESNTNQNVSSLNTITVEKLDLDPSASGLSMVSATSENHELIQTSKQQIDKIFKSLSPQKATTPSEVLELSNSTISTDLEQEDEICVISSTCESDVKHNYSKQFSGTEFSMDESVGSSKDVTISAEQKIEIDEIAISSKGELESSHVLCEEDLNETCSISEVTLPVDLKSEAIEDLTSELSISNRHLTDSINEILNKTSTDKIADTSKQDVTVQEGDSKPSNDVVDEVIEGSISQSSIKIDEQHLSDYQSTYEVFKKDTFEGSRTFHVISPEKESFNISLSAILDPKEDIIFSENITEPLTKIATDDLITRNISEKLSQKTDSSTYTIDPQPEITIVPNPNESVVNMEHEQLVYSDSQNRAAVDISPLEVSNVIDDKIMDTHGGPVLSQKSPESLNLQISHESTGGTHVIDLKEADSIAVLHRTVIEEVIDNQMVCEGLDCDTHLKPQEEASVDSVTLKKEEVEDFVVVDVADLDKRVSDPAPPQLSSSDSQDKEVLDVAQVSDQLDAEKQVDKDNGKFKLIIPSALEVSHVEITDNQSQMKSECSLKESIKDNTEVIDTKATITGVEKLSNTEIIKENDVEPDINITKHSIVADVISTEKNVISSSLVMSSVEVKNDVSTIVSEVQQFNLQVQDVMPMDVELEKKVESVRIIPENNSTTDFLVEKEVMDVSVPKEEKLPEVEVLKTEVDKNISVLNSDFNKTTDDFEFIKNDNEERQSNPINSLSPDICQVITVSEKKNVDSDINILQNDEHPNILKPPTKEESIGKSNDFKLEQIQSKTILSPTNVEESTDLLHSRLEEKCTISEIISEKQIDQYSSKILNKDIVSPLSDVNIISVKKITKDNAVVDESSVACNYDANKASSRRSPPGTDVTNDLFSEIFQHGKDQMCGVTTKYCESKHSKSEVLAIQKGAHDVIEQSYNSATCISKSTKDSSDFFKSAGFSSEDIVSDKVKSPPFACPVSSDSIAFGSPSEYSLSLSPIDSFLPGTKCELPKSSPSDTSAGNSISAVCYNKTHSSSAEIGEGLKSSSESLEIVKSDVSIQNNELSPSLQATLQTQGEMSTRNEKYSYTYNKSSKDFRGSPANKNCEEVKYSGLSDNFRTFKLDDLSKSTIERKSYEDLLDRCLEQERLLGFDETIKEEADKLIKEIANASSDDICIQPDDFPPANANSSEAGPVTADEDLNKAELFQDATLFDFDYLSKIGKGKPSRRLVRESLFLKFDPLAAAAAAGATPEPAQEMAQADSSDVINTPPRAPILHHNGDDKLVSITPNDEAACSPASSTVATPPRSKARPSSGTATPTLRHEILSKEISKLQDLMMRQESSYQEQIAARTEEVEQLREQLAELEARDNQVDLQGKLAVTEAEAVKLRKELAEATESKKQLMMIMEEYEKTISQVVTMREDDKKKFEIEKEQISMEREGAMQHLRNMEIAFNDVHQKYEKCKEVIEAFKHNEEQYKISLNENRKTIIQQEENYQKLKEHAAQKLEQANIEISEMKKAHQAEIARMVAVQRKMEIRVKSLEESLEQKKREAAELTKICDDLITKVEQ
ncbi:serine-rich adhesin for platelets isoform X2 [Halyomorpha halys]|uniref:serine-rich adhesin for platelets isoform X2 n=1 Tax=Halyomorpha halys TaxID=286706 RepID=UPI0006D4D2CF|nr:uncharacterized protein PFB0145c-like isoform X2 [Halyomorpha halys]